MRRKLEETERWIYLTSLEEAWLELEKRYNMNKNSLKGGEQTVRFFTSGYHLSALNGFKNDIVYTVDGMSYSRSHHCLPTKPEIISCKVIREQRTYKY